MEDKRFTPDIIARAEELISRIQGIRASRITSDETGRILEVHVVASAPKSAKLYSRDVETCLKAELGINVDYKKIGVAIYDGGSPESSGKPQRKAAVDSDESIQEFPVEEFPSRFAFQSVNLFISQDGIKAEVELALEGMEAFGSAGSDNAAHPRRELIAEAALKAVSEFLDEKLRLCLLDVREILLGDEPAVAVRVDFIRGRERKSLAGCSIVTDDVNKTVVYATLDAVNRILGKLKSNSSLEYKIE